MMPYDWKAHGWENSGGGLYSKTFQTEEDAKAFMEAEKPSAEVQARMDKYKAKFANATVAASVTWHPGMTYEENNRLLREDADRRRNEVK